MTLNLRMNIENEVHLYNGVLIRHKKNNDIMKFADKWMALGGKHHLESHNETQKDKHGMHSLISGYCMESKGQADYNPEPQKS